MLLFFFPGFFTDTYLSLCVWCSSICQTEHYPLLCLGQAEAAPSTSDSSGPSALQPEQQPGLFRPQAPNLAGAVEFNDVKTLLKEWITTISGEGCHTGVITKKIALSKLFVLPLSFTLVAYFSQYPWSLLTWQSWKNLILSTSCCSVALSDPVSCLSGKLTCFLFKPCVKAVLKEMERTLDFKNCSCDTLAKLWFELGQTNGNSLKPREICPSYIILFIRVSKQPLHSKSQSLFPLVTASFTVSCSYWKKKGLQGRYLRTCSPAMCTASDVRKMYENTEIVRLVPNMLTLQNFFLLYSHYSVIIF